MSQKPEDSEVGGVGRRSFLKVGGALGVSGVSFRDGFSHQELEKEDDTPSIRWKKTYGEADYDDFHSVIEVDNGFVVAGDTSSWNTNGLKGWLVKLDRNGEKQWDKIYDDSSEGETRKNTVISSVTQVSDGFVCVGYFSAQDSGSEKGWLLKTDEKGNKEWERKYESSYRSSLESVAEVGDGYVGAGFKMASETEKPDGWLIKVNKSGEKQWENTYGKSNEDVFNSLVAMDNGFLAAGSTKDSKRSSTEGWVVKTDEKGNKKWRTKHGKGKFNLFNTVTEMSDGLVAAGTTQDSSSGLQGWLVKMDKKGNMKWEKKHSGSRDHVISSVTEMSDGFGVAGVAPLSDEDVYDENAWLMKTDEKGEKTWKKKYTGLERDALNSVVGLDSGFVAAGMTKSSGSGKRDGWLINVSNSGTKSVLKVVANWNKEDNKIDFKEVQQAVSWWVSDEKVPGTGKKLNFSKLQEIIKLWTTGEKV